MKLNSKIVFTISILAIAFNANSQVAIDNVEEIAKIKNGTTYIAMKDPNSEKAKKYVEVLKNNWTFSKFEIIKYSDVSKYLAPGNSFLTIGGYVTNVQSMTLYSNGSKSGVDWANTHIYLELWTGSEKFFKNTKKDKELKDKEKSQIARIELFTDFPTLMTPANLYLSDYDASGHIRNWGPGILKNQIQYLTSLLNKAAEKDLYENVINPTEVKKLANEVLYVPDYVFIKFNKFTGDEKQKHEEKEIFEDYSLKYKVLPIGELNNKILNETTPFYYLEYIKSSTDKYIKIINSVTGEVIYSVYSPVSYNIKSGDLKDLQKAIQKK